MKQGIVTLVVLVATLTGLAWIGSDSIRAAGYVVDSSIDDQWAHDASPGDYVCADTFGSCTLRAAIEEANAQGGPHTITFQDREQASSNIAGGAGQEHKGFIVHGVNNRAEGMGFQGGDGQLHAAHRKIDNG